MKLRRCQDRFRFDVSVGFIVEHEQLLEKVSLKVGKLLIDQTGPFFPCPVAFKFCSVCLFVCLFVCLSPMQSESQVGARCRDSDKERTLTHRELPTCRCNAWQCNAMMPTCCCNVWQCNAILPSFRCNAWQCNAMLPTCCCNAWHSNDDGDGDGDDDLDDDDEHDHDRDDVEDNE